MLMLILILMLMLTLILILILILMLTLMLERFSNECRKTKTKVITLANQKDGDNPVNQSKLVVIIRSRHKARENVHARATIGFGFTSDWLKKWRENFEPISE